VIATTTAAAAGLVVGVVGAGEVGQGQETITQMARVLLLWLTLQNDSSSLSSLFSFCSEIIITICYQPLMKYLFFFLFLCFFFFFVLHTLT
jgi:hypothetical protein